MRVPRGAPLDEDRAGSTSPGRVRAKARKHARGGRAPTRSTHGLHPIQEPHRGTHDRRTHYPRTRRTPRGRHCRSGERRSGELRGDGSRDSVKIGNARRSRASRCASRRSRPRRGEIVIRQMRRRTRRSRLRCIGCGRNATGQHWGEKNSLETRSGGKARAPGFETSSSGIRGPRRRAGSSLGVVDVYEMYT
jgi:hypothetical protein